MYFDWAQRKGNRINLWIDKHKVDASVFIQDDVDYTIRKIFCGIYIAEIYVDALGCLEYTNCKPFYGLAIISPTGKIQCDKGAQNSTAESL
jgi:hypothetical protein